MFILIIVHKLGREKKQIVINAEKIEIVDEIPDTVIHLVTGKKIIVVEKKEEIIEMVIEYRRKVLL